jgi:hypothetical protein
MRRILVVVALALGVLPAVAVAQNFGINLAWNACLSEGGVGTRTNTCTSNLGTHQLVGSFVPAYDMPTFVGIEATLLVLSTEPQLPDWWQLYYTGACRRTALSVIVQFNGLPNQECVDPFFGQGIGAADFTTPYLGRSDAGRIRVAAAIPAPSPIIAGVEYYGFIVSISNSFTTGPEACTGCDVGTCIGLQSVALVGNDLTRQVLDFPIQTNVAIYQCGTLVIADGPGGGGPACVAANCPTAAARRSWGQIKSLYR